MITGIHQLLSRCEAGDAISNHALALQGWFARFAESRLYVEAEHPDMVGGAEPYTRYQPDSHDVLVLHASIGSPLVDVAAANPGRTIVDFHNFTPARFFVEWDPPVARLLERAWEQLARLAPVTDVALADSTYNARLLAAAGFREPAVVPIACDLAAFDREPDSHTAARLTEERARGGARLLFVGRLCANKGQHHLVRALALYRRHVDPDARLWLVGGDFTPSYTAALRRLAEAAGVADAVEITGSVPFGALRAHYRAADVFVSASEHEGFGVPLLEAMHCGIPVVALGAAAVPETVGTAALLVDDADPGTLAAAVGIVLDDGALRAELVRRGRDRAAAFSAAAVRARLAEVVEPHLARWAA